MKKIIVFGALLLVGFGCTSTTNVDVETGDTIGSGSSANISATINEEALVDLPIAEYIERRTYKGFGEYIQDRFTGYHVGDDIEYADVEADVPVQSIADGTIVKKGDVSGYGGVIVINHVIQGEHISAIYGHLDLASSDLKEGDAVTRGQFIGNLGDHESEETDGERKHLHFAVYFGDDVRLSGYEPTAEGVKDWVNPQNFFENMGLDMTTNSRVFEPDRDLGGDVFNVRFRIPEGWEVEYIPSIQSLNLYTVSGNGTARERSQMFIRYFDASSFLTLSTVEIYSSEDRTVGKGYTARRYDIEKKPGVADFADQPYWRNTRHIVTDFRAEEGYTRYYVVAMNPDIDPDMYEHILGSMTVVE